MESSALFLFHLSQVFAVAHVRRRVFPFFAFVWGGVKLVEKEGAGLWGGELACVPPPFVTRQLPQ